LITCTRNWLQAIAGFGLEIADANSIEALKSK
jgi:hypothetical protein